MCVWGGGGGGGGGRIIEVVRDLHMPGLPSFFLNFLHQIKIGRCSTKKKQVHVHTTSQTIILHQNQTTTKSR